MNTVRIAVMLLTYSFHLLAAQKLDFTSIISPPKDNKGVLLSFGGGASLIRASGTYVDDTEQSFQKSTRELVSSKLCLGGNGGIRMGYQFGKVPSILLGVDVVSKRLRYQIGESQSTSTSTSMTSNPSKENEKSTSLYVEYGGTALEFPILFRPVISSFGSPNRRMILMVGVSPSIQMTDESKIYTDESGFSKRKILFDTNLITIEYPLFTVDNVKKDTILLETLQYNDFTRRGGLSGILSIGTERFVAENISFFWTFTYRRSLIDSKRLSAKAESSSSKYKLGLVDESLFYGSGELALGFLYYL